MVRPSGMIPLIAATVSLVLALLVWRNAPSRTIGRVFALLGISLLFWNLTFFALHALNDYNQALEYSRLFRTVGIFVLPAMLHLALALPGRPILVPWRTVLIIDYSLTIILAILNFNGLFVTRLDTFHWGFYSVTTGYYHAFAFSVVLNFLAATFALAKEYLATDSPRMRLQLKFWLFGMAVASPLGVTNLLPTYGVHIYPLGNLASAVWAGIVAYAILRYRLMDVDLIVATLASYLAATMLCIVPMVAAVLWLQEWAFDDIHYDFSALVALILVVTGFAFPALRSVAQGHLERWLFRSKYESRAALAALGVEVVRILDRNQLCGVVSEALGAAFSVHEVALYVRDDARGRFELFRGRKDDLLNTAFSDDHPFVRWLARRSEPVLQEEARLDGDDRGSLRAAGVMAQHGWQVGVPFSTGKRLLGFVCLGQRRALQAYTADDLGVLASLSMEISTALHNAHLYEELRRSREIISRTGRLSALGTLAAGIAHEIRNPLVSIQTFFQLAPNRLSDEEFMTSFLKLAESEVQRISALIGELLAFAKSPTPSFREIDLNEVAERAVVLLEPQAKSLSVRLSVKAKEHLAPVLADPDQVMQVILNLALNALQASGTGGEVAVEVREVEREGMWFCQVEVRDSGNGIPAEMTESIFNPFFTTKDKGTGLGLSIAHRIVAESGGFISVESIEGHGARFYVHLPAVLSGRTIEVAAEQERDSRSLV